MARHCPRPEYLWSNKILKYKGGIDQKYAWQTQGNKQLRNLVNILDDWTQMFFGTEIVVTSAIRPKGDRKSYHPIGQAIDLRTKNLSDLVITGWVVLITMINNQRKSFPDFEGKFTWVQEDKGGNNDHFQLIYIFSNFNYFFCIIRI